MFCKNCGQYIDDDSKFCKNCGTSQAVMASVGVINRTNNRSGVLEVPSTITVENFVSMLFAKGWIPNSAFVISSLKISPVKDESYIIYSGYKNIFYIFNSLSNRLIFCENLFFSYLFSIGKLLIFASCYFLFSLLLFCSFFEILFSKFFPF